MLDYLRILKGLQIDETVVIVTGSIDPSVTGYSADEGSLFLRSTGQLYTKTGVANTNWTLNSSTSLQLYNESPVAPIAPSATGTNSVAIGSGAVSSNTDTMAIGGGASALNAESVALGYQATTNADKSLAIGEQSLSRIQGGVVQASGRFATTGDAQTGRYLLRTVTLNSALTECFVDGTGGSIRVVLPDNSTWTFHILVTGHRTDADDGHAGYEFSGVIYRQSGAATTAIQGNVTKDILAESNAPWDATVSADNVNGALIVQVKGQVGKTIRWLALVETVEVTN